MNDFKSYGGNTNFVRRVSRNKVGLVIAFAGIVTSSIVFVKKLNKNAEDKLRKY